MPHRGVSGRMHKAFQKLHKNISTSNVNYKSIHHNGTTSPPKTGAYVRNGCVFGRSGRFAGDDDSDYDSDDCAPYDVPEGNLVVYVGEERRRFVIKAQHLTHPVFRALLDKSAEEFGYEHKRGLEIACEVGLFEHLLWLIESNDPSLSSMEVEELVGFHAYS